MTQVQLAEIMDVRVQQINKYANDKQKMSIETAKTISVILNCPIDDLYEWVEVGV
jgi:DNA-binding XRE family transcriptional regulator